MSYDRLYRRNNRRVRRPPDLALPPRSFPTSRPIVPPIHSPDMAQPLILPSPISPSFGPSAYGIPAPSPAYYPGSQYGQRAYPVSSALMPTQQMYPNGASTALQLY